jgi:hypothetical protein
MYTLPMDLKRGPAVSVICPGVCYVAPVDQPSGRKRTRVPGKSTSNGPAEAASAPTAPPRDTVLIHGVSEDGQKLAVLRTREDRVEAGVISKLKEGEPMHGELVRLTPRADFPLLCDVEVELSSASAQAAERPKLSHGGPAQVATPSYRTNWDAIWRKPAGKPN